MENNVADEVNRLKEELKECNAARSRLHSIMTRRGEEIERLNLEIEQQMLTGAYEINKKNKRIDELEKVEVFMVGDSNYRLFVTGEKRSVENGYIITDDEIDLVVGMIEENQDPHDYHIITEALERLGFVMCRRCGGGVSEAWDNGCPSCRGRGWVKK